MTSTQIWFMLLDADLGQPYKGTTADCVSLPLGAVVAELRKLVHRKNSSILTSIVPSQLLVYKNKADFGKRSAVGDEGKEEPLKSSLLLDGLGGTEDEAVIVVVPSQGSVSSQTTTEQRVVKEPNHKRKQRWIELNKILENAKKSSRVDDKSR